MFPVATSPLFTHLERSGSHNNSEPSEVQTTENKVIVLVINGKTCSHTSYISGPGSIFLKYWTLRISRSSVAGLKEFYCIFERCKACL